MSLFEPDRLFARITAIDIERDLIGQGLTNVLLDIDNTIRSRATHDVPRDVAVWMGKARDAGINFCLLSNNWHANAHEFAKEVNLPIIAKACKPLPHGYALAMHKLCASRKNSVVVGDQLLTDVVGAHLLGIPAYMVMPLAEVDLKHTLVLRNVEHALMGKHEPEPVTCTGDEK